MSFVKSALLGLLVSTTAMSAAAHEAAASATAAKPSKPFGPFEAGDVRGVKRGGKSGKARPLHPMVGEAAKVPASGPPAPPLRTDPDLPELALSTGNSVGSALSANPLYLAALFYSGFLTKVDGPRCRHYPTCSRFANQAVARHGVIGIFLGLERVITDESSSSVRRLPEIDMPNDPQPRYFDPVDNYEFWLPGRLQAFPDVVPEEPLALESELAARDEPRDDVQAAASDDAATQRMPMKGLPKCKNGHTLRPLDDGDVEERCAPDRS